MATKQVRQSTFDGIVCEGIQEFGFSPEEAVTDACEQLRKSGVTDFSNLDISIPSNESRNSQSSASLVHAVRDTLHSENPSDLIDAVSTLISNLNDKRDAASAVSNGIIEVLADCMGYSLKFHYTERLSVVRPMSELLVILCANDELNRSSFITLPGAKGLRNMKSLFNSLVLPNSLAEQGRETSVFDFETCAALVQSMSAIQLKKEHVKQVFAANESLDCLIKYFENACCGIIESNDDEKTLPKKLFVELCVYTRQLLSPDDSTVKVAETFDRARVLAGGNTVTESGLRPLTTSSNLLEIFSRFIVKVQVNNTLSQTTKLQLMTESIACIRICCVSDEICSHIIKLNIHESCTSLLQQFSLEENIVNVCIGLLRNLAGRDECKSPIFENITLLTDVVRQHLGTCSMIGEQYCGLIGSLCLRRPDLANKIVKTGMADIVLDVMEMYNEDKILQRVGCLAVRNICARDVEARCHLRKTGLAEKIIRKAWRTHSHCDDVAYAALRDMDVLEDSELRRDERYTMPTGFYNTPTVREKGR
ncbi:unnamed protein product [Agarophyton chilense]